MEEHDGVRYSIRFCIEDGENSTFECKDEEQLLTLFWMQHKRFDCVTIMDVKEKELHLFDDAVKAYDYIAEKINERMEEFKTCSQK